MKDALCKAFCDELHVHKVPAGLAVSTAFAAPDGDRVAFYVVEQTDGYRIEDDGLMLPNLEASLDLRSGTRGEAFAELLTEYSVAVDEESKEFHITGLTADEVPAAALRFVAFTLRVRDFMLMTEYRVATTFREDAERMLREVIGNKAEIEKNVAISPKAPDFIPDFVIRAKGRTPVAVFLGISDNRVLEALFLHMRLRYELEVECLITALLEKADSLTAKVRQQAVNRLDALPEFRGDETAAIAKLADVALGPPQTVH